MLPDHPQKAEVNSQLNWPSVDQSHTYVIMCCLVETQLMFTKQCFLWKFLSLEMGDPYVPVIPVESISKHCGSSVIWKLRKRENHGNWQNEDRASAQRAGLSNAERNKLPTTAPSVLLLLRVTLLLQHCLRSFFLFVLVGLSNWKGQYWNAR